MVTDETSPAGERREDIDGVTIGQGHGTVLLRSLPVYNRAALRRTMHKSKLSNANYLSGKYAIFCYRPIECEQINYRHAMSACN